MGGQEHCFDENPTEGGGALLASGAPPLLLLSYLSQQNSNALLENNNLHVHTKPPSEANNFPDEGAQPPMSCQTRMHA